VDHLPDGGTGAGIALRANAFCASPLATLILEASGVVVAANVAAGHLLATNPQALLGTNLGAFASQSEKRELLAAIQLASSGGVTARREARFLRPDGSLRIGGFSLARLAYAGAPSARVVVAIRDVTEEVLVQQKLIEAQRSSKILIEREAEQRREAEDTRLLVEAGLLLLIDSVPDLVFVHRNGRIIYVNDVAVRALGHEGPADLLGRPILDLEHPDGRGARGGGRPPLPPSLHRIAAGSEHLPPRPARVLGRDGTYRDVEFVGFPIVFEGEPAVLALGRDLTERRKLEAQLALGERLVAMGTLAAGIGHEVNNPLTSVVGNLESLTEELSQWGSFVPPDRLADAMSMLEACREGSARVRTVVAGLRGLSAGSGALTDGIDAAAEATPVDVSRAMDRAIGVSAHEVSCRARLVKQYGSSPRVLADEGRLTQVFLNLLVNAAQAIPEGRAEQNEIGVVIQTDLEGRAQITIADTGVGIAPEYLRRIFDPFFTLRPVGLGSGLGLSIAHDIVTSLGGTIEVSSTVGEGTTVMVRLPAGPAAAGAPVKASGLAPSARRGRILVVDDESSIRAVARRMLESEYDVTLADSGAQAIALLEGGARFDLILCDLMMPNVTGMELHEMVLALAPAQAGRMVFMTGGAFTERASAFLDAATNELITKPLPKAADLRALARRYVDETTPQVSPPRHAP
jgi:PAS domain S-box-containing protein